MEELIKKLKSIYDKYTSMTNIHREVAEETKKNRLRTPKFRERLKNVFINPINLLQSTSI